jgi:hypothetical protein
LNFCEVRIWISICTTMALVEGPKQAILEALMTRGEVAVKNIRDCRAMSSLFRQFAVFDPVH